MTNSMTRNGVRLIAVSSVVILLGACGTSTKSSNSTTTAAPATTVVKATTTLAPVVTTAAPTTVAPVTTTTAATPPGFTKEPASGALTKGMTGTRVMTMQKKLKGAGFDPGNPDGLFGEQTDAALRAFQKAKNLAADGIFGPQSQAALETACPQGKAGC